MFCSFDIFQPGLVARRVAIVPVAVQQGTVRHPHNVAISLVERQRFGAVHPEGVFHFEMVEITPRAAHAIFFEQFNHQGENRRLRAAQIIGPVAVGNMAIVFNHPGEIIRHTFK